MLDEQSILVITWFLFFFKNKSMFINHCVLVEQKGNKIYTHIVINVNERVIISVIVS